MLPKESTTISEIPKMPEPKRIEKKTSRFSLKWFLRKTKPSQTEKPAPKVIPKSKSCDVHFSSIVPGKECGPNVPYVQIQRKISASALCGQLKVPDPIHIFKTSYSSNDVQSLARPYAGEDSLLHPNVYSLSQPRAGPAVSRTDIATKTPLSPDSYTSGEDLVGAYGPKVCEMVQCRLCLMHVNCRELYTMKECGCIFCVSCVQQYLTINIREGNVSLSCPDGECTKVGLMQPPEVEELVDRNIYDMFERFKLIQEVHLDPTRTWCPTPDCETICPVNPSSELGRGVAITCPNCHLMFCSLCMERWHVKRTCEEVQRERQEVEELLMVQDDDPIIKRCPNCRVPIERDEGCAQMMCKRCKHVFCWYCLTSLDDDFLLRHYDKGPCKNKLGHSRASVVWHRTQVVGIFAGFGFLLLVASPLLLLAAPCLLCCRCKNCTKFFDEEPTAV